MLFLFLLIASSCGNSKKQAEFSGGTFSLCLKSSYSAIDPMMMDDYPSIQILGQIYEGLVSFDPKEVTVQPQLAKNYKIKNAGLTYEFTLRDNVYFHDFGESDRNRKLTPEDVIFSIERACKPIEMDGETVAYTQIYKDRIKGADEYFKNKTDHISGIKAEGNVITIELIQPDFNFLAKMCQPCCAIVSKKLFKEKGQPIGTGPFILNKELENSINLKLLKNPEYYMTDETGCSLPYLDTLEFIFQPKKLVELTMFENKKLDIIIGLPPSRITTMLEGRIADFTTQPPKMYLHNSPIMRTDYYFFNLTEKRFKDVRVRQAFNYAVDKVKIGQNILRNQFFDLGFYGIVPPLRNLFRGYDFDEVKKYGYQFDPAKAKALLAAAGYPNGKDFGTVTLRFNIDDVHSAVADEFAKQIKTNLGITVNIDGSSFEQLTRDQENLNGDIFRTAWIADYPSPESFLQKFAGKFVPKNRKSPSRLNPTRYINPKFDNYYEKAIESNNLSSRRKYFRQADIELLKDPPIIPLWYSGELCISYSHVRNFHFNSIDSFDFRKVYKKNWTKKEYQDYMNRKS